MSRISHLLIHTLVQKRKVRVPTGTGAHTETMSTVATLLGRVNPSRKFPALLAKSPKARVRHIIFLEPESDVQVNDEFVFETRVLRVLIPNVTPSIPIYKQVLTEEIQD